MPTRSKSGLALRKSAGELEIRALTIGQPWAELILRRRKPFEIRGWTTKYRGPILIHAGLKWNAADAEALGITREEATCGAFVGIAKLKEVRRYTRADAKLLREKRGGLGGWGPGEYAWVLTSVRRIEPIPFKGQLGLYRPPERILRKLKHVVQDSGGRLKPEKGACR